MDTSEFYRMHQLLRIEILRLSTSLDAKPEEVNHLLQILTSYTFENRLGMKGTLSRIMVDSLDLPYALGEKVIQFDKAIY
jgi:hypothetical protein